MDTINKPKEIDEILDEQIETGLREHRRSNLGLFLSSFSAGLEVGFSLFLMGIVYTLFHGQVSSSVLHTLIALSYPIAFIFVVIGKSELFTEHTTLAVLPVLKGDATLKSLGILWLVIFVGNLLGGYLFAYILTNVAPAMKIISIDSFVSLALKMTSFSSETILLSGILAGWLMGLLSWLVTSSQETISRIFVVILVTASIGMGGLHHSIVGSIEVFAGLVVSQKITLNEYLRFQLFTTLGNIIGGVVFVALLKYSHVKGPTRS